MNMQIVNTGLTGKVFALSRCSVSQDKKTRNRRTKEERKTMVESFVKTYQELNNGKFPSLNLTHKEVGGSFYTVREIVREIIQDNRVLGPGNVNSKVLNLEDCDEEQAEDSVSMDSAAHLSIATFSQPTVQRQETISSSSTKHIRAREEIIDTDKSCIQESAAHLNELPIFQVRDGEHHHGINLSTDDNLVGFEEMGAVVEVKDKQDPEIYMAEHRISQENASIASLENMVNDDEPGYKSDNMAKETSSSASGNYSPKIAETDSLLETNITLNCMTGGVSEQVQDSPFYTEATSFASTTSKACNPDSTQEMGAVVEVKDKQDPESYMVEHQIIRENVSITSPENMVNDDEPGYKSDNMAKETSSSASGNYSLKIAETDSLLETNITLNPMTGGVSEQVQDSHFYTEDTSFASTTSKACNPDSTQEVEGSANYLEVSKTSAAEVGMADTQFGRSYIKNKTEQIKLHPSSVVEGTPAESPSKSVSQDFHAVDSKRSLEDGSESFAYSTGNASGERLHVSVKGTTRGVLEAARARGISNIIIASKSSSISFEESSKEPEETQSNPVWDIFGSWLSAFVKFFTG